MKDPKDIKTYADLPWAFHDVVAERIGGFDELNKMTRQELVKEKSAWELGSTAWYDSFEDWLNKAGLKIVEDEQR